MCPLLVLLSFSAAAPAGAAEGALDELRRQAGEAAVEAPAAEPAEAEPAAAAGRSAGPVMLQGFHWLSHKTSPWWGVIAAKAADIAASGIDLVWLPPSSEAQSDEGYLPSRLYVQTSTYGTRDELKGAIQALHANGVKAVADVVLNHRVGTKGWADFEEPAWGPEAVCSDDEWAGARGKPDTGKAFHAARDVDHTDPAIQKSLAGWLRWLETDIGYDGWRYDFARGFGSEYLSMYHDATAPSFAVAEVWDDFDPGSPDAHRQRLADWVDSVGGRAGAFDFTTKALLHQAVSAGEYWRLADRQGKPAGFLGWWPEKAVTFLDNHDTGPSTGGSGQNMWPFPGDKVMQGYAYILTHPGTPCVYWPHLYDWGLHDELQALIRARKAAGIGLSSPVRIAAADGGRYAAFVGDGLAVKIGPADWSPGAGWSLAASGKGYAVWRRP